MLTQREIDRITLEAEMEVDALFYEFYAELLGDRADIMALMQQKEMADAQGQMELDDEMLMGGSLFGETEGV